MLQPPEPAPPMIRQVVVSPTITLQFHAKVLEVGPIESAKPPVLRLTVDPKHAVHLKVTHSYLSSRVVHRGAQLSWGISDVVGFFGTPHSTVGRTFIFDVQQNVADGAVAWNTLERTGESITLASPTTASPSPLVLRARPDKRVFRAGDSPSISCIVSSPSESVERFWIGGCQTDVRLRDRSGSEPELKEAGRFMRERFGSGTCGISHIPITLSPGEEYQVIPVHLDEHFVLERGAYTATCSYVDTNPACPEGAPTGVLDFTQCGLGGFITSKAVRFRVAR